MAKAKIQYPVNYKVIGNRIQQARMRAGLTQETIAEKLDVSIEHISRIENGHIDFNLKVLFCLADLVKVPPESLISDTMIFTDETLPESKFAKILSRCDQKKIDLIYKIAEDVAES